MLKQLFDAFEIERPQSEAAGKIAAIRFDRLGAFFHADTDLTALLDDATPIAQPEKFQIEIPVAKSEPSINFDAPTFMIPTNPDKDPEQLKAAYDAVHKAQEGMTNPLFDNGKASV